MKKTRFLWVDDEIDLLKPYILFLEEKGYEVDTVNNGRDAVEMFRTSAYDMVFLDEHMPGLSGLETLTLLHSLNHSVPVVMITKSEDEGIMNQAIGKKIADYLIKPVNPNQILMTIKKILDKKGIIAETATINYREEFGLLSSEIQQCASHEDWVNVCKKLIYWDVELSQTQHSMQEVLEMQKSEAENEFCKFIKCSYENWIQNPDDAPLMSQNLLSSVVFPWLERGEKLFFVLIDNFRLDQWQAIKDIISDSFTCIEDTYFSILPTATQYARNAVFSGLMPAEIAKSHPDCWVEETEDEGKNLMEQNLLQLHLERSGLKKRFSYHRINSNAEGEKLVNSFPDLLHFDLNALVFNFIDIMSHARTESKMIRELAADEAAYRSLTRSWFLHSPLLSLLKKIAESGYKVVLTTDHGTIRVKKPVQVISEKNTTTNLRYKTGRNLSYDSKKVFEITVPEGAGLPSPNISTRYIFALNSDFFVYPNNQNHYVSFYGDTFQHGGVSMQEMIVPLITLHPK